MSRKTELIKISALFEIMELLCKKVSKDLTIQQISMFLKVAMEEGVTMRDLAANLGLHPTTISRNVKEFSNYAVVINGEKVTKGFGLLISAPNEFHRREFSIFLTVKGKALIREIENIMSK